MCRAHNTCVLEMACAVNLDTAMLHCSQVMMHEWNHAHIRDFIKESGIQNPFLPLLAQAHAVQIAMAQTGTKVICSS